MIRSIAVSIIAGLMISAGIRTVVCAEPGERMKKAMGIFMVGVGFSAFAIMLWTMPPSIGPGCSFIEGW